MRTDELGKPCPATLGEYRDLCVVAGPADSDAIRYLDAKIATDPAGRDAIVVAEDSQMRHLLMMLMFKKNGRWRYTPEKKA